MSTSAAAVVLRRHSKDRERDRASPYGDKQLPSRFEPHDVQAIAVWVKDTLDTLQDAHNGLGAAIFIYRKMLLDKPDQCMRELRRQLRKLKASVAAVFEEIAAQTNSGVQLVDLPMTSKLVLSQRSKAYHCVSCTCHYADSFALEHIARWLSDVRKFLQTVQYRLCRLPPQLIHTHTQSKLNKICRVVDSELLYCREACATALEQEADGDSSSWGSQVENDSDNDLAAAVDAELEPADESNPSMMASTRITSDDDDQHSCESGTDD
jgi:hypothetical protein